MSARLHDEVERLRNEMLEYEGRERFDRTEIIRLGAEVERLRAEMHEATVTLAGLAEREYAAKLAYDRLRAAFKGGGE